MTDKIATKEDLIIKLEEHATACGDALKTYYSGWVIEIAGLFISLESGSPKTCVEPWTATIYSSYEECREIAVTLRNGNGTRGMARHIAEVLSEKKYELTRMVDMLRSEQ